MSTITPISPSASGKPAPNLPNPPTQAPNNTWLNGSNPAPDTPGSELGSIAEIQLLARHVQTGPFEPPTSDFLVPVLLDHSKPAELFSSLEDALAAARTLSMGSDHGAVAVSEHSWERPDRRFALTRTTTIQNTGTAGLHFETGTTSAGSWFDVPIVDARFGAESRTSFVRALVDGDATISQGPLT